MPPTPLGSTGCNGCMDEQPPERIDAGPVVLRRIRLTDAEAIAEAVLDSLDHLRPWMPWATSEAVTAAAQRKRVEESWSVDNEFAYVMLIGEPDTTVVGGCGLGRSWTGHLAIGYWVHLDHLRHGYATAAARALTDAAWTIRNYKQVEIHCDLANAASAAIPPRLGYRLERIVDAPIQAPGHTGKSMIWSISRPSVTTVPTDPAASSG